MSKLEIVRESLEKGERDGKIIMVEKPEPEDFEVRIEDSEIILPYRIVYGLAPKNPIYSADGLNEFMMGLIPLEPDEKEYFKWYCYRIPLLGIRFHHMLKGGWVEFSDKIAEEKTIEKTNVTDSELLKSMHGRAQESEIVAETRDIFRKTVIEQYPDERIARDIMEGKIDYPFTLKNLKGYKQLSEGRSPEPSFLEVLKKMIPAKYF
ncbi:MAG: hypothetical protein NTY20_04830 [Candidatus Aenigmarchaeota archaeon]|nr:hypothetical protein [Candidatus Aenigmarchaeota archaeon]